MEIFRTGKFKLTLSKEMQDVLYAEQKRYLPEDLEENDIINFPLGPQASIVSAQHRGHPASPLTK